MKNININKNQKISLVIIVLFEINFFNLVPWPVFYYNHISNVALHNGEIIVILILLFVKFVQSFKTDFVSIKSPTFFDTTVICIIFSALSVIVGSMFAYDQSFYQTYMVVNYLPMLLGFFAFKEFFQKQKNVDFFVKVIINFALIYLLIVLFQSFMFSRGTVVFQLFQFNSYIQNSINSQVLGFSRVPLASDITTFSVILSAISVLYPQKIKVSHPVFRMLMGWIYTVLASQTRALIIMISVILLATVVFYVIQKKNLVSMIISLPVVLIMGLVFNRLLPTLQLTAGNRAISVSIRFLEIDYYVENGTLNGWFGIGATPDSVNYWLNHGWMVGATKGYFFYDDVGIFGYYGMFGIVGVIFLIPLFYNLIKGFSRSQMKYGVLLMTGYLIGTSPTIFLINNVRIVYFVFVLLMLSYMFGVSGEKNE